LQQYAGEIAARVGTNVNVIELGAQGQLPKTGTILKSAFAAAVARELYPVDISVSALQVAAASLEAESAAVRVHPVATNYIADSDSWILWSGKSLSCIWVQHRKL